MSNINSIVNGDGYVIIRSDGVREIDIPKLQVNTDDTSIPLIGQGISPYGQLGAQSWIHMLENFASTTSPDAPITGQLWFERDGSGGTGKNGILRLNVSAEDGDNGVNGTQWETVMTSRNNIAISGEDGGGSTGARNVFLDNQLVFINEDGNLDFTWTATSTTTRHELKIDVLSAPKWTTARTISLSGDVSGSVSMDGSGNVNMSTIVADDSHNHIIANVDGLQAALDNKVNIGDTVARATTADRWTNARTITLAGDSTGSVSIDGSSNATLTVTVVNDSHTHDTRYLQLTGGTVTGTVTAAAFNTSSSLRYKDNVEDAEARLVKAFDILRPVEYDLKITGKHDLGFIAEEVIKEVPELVQTNDDGSAEAIDYSRLTTVLTAKIRSQEKTINALMERLAEIEKKLK